MTKKYIYYVCLFCSFSNDTKLCDYSTPWNNATWMCRAPPNGVCSKITNIVADYKKPRENIIWKKICQIYVCDKTLPKFDILVNEALQEKSLNFLQNIPNCSQIFERNTEHLNSISGYFEDQIWKSLVCRNQVNASSFQSYKRCLQSKVIYMLGDSTIRQLFLGIAKHFGLKVIEPLRSDIWQQPRFAFDASKSMYNISLYYRAHGPPMKSPGPPFSKPFISDTIRNIKVGGRLVFVVFTIGIHFHEINPSILLQRLKYIRIAILQHHYKFSETKFLIKGMDNVGPASFWNWQLFRYDVILKNYFKNLKNVFFINFWDISSIWRMQNDVHPKPKLSEQEALLLLNHICG